MRRFCILILEDAVVTSVALSKALQAELPDASILRARTLFEARLLLSSYEIEFFLIDVTLPDGCGIDLLEDIIVRNPAAGVVIMTGESLPRHPDHASVFGVIHFFEKPVPPKKLVSIVRDFKATVYDSAIGSETSFSGVLTRLNAMDLLQLKCLSRANSRLDFRLSDGRNGSVFFKDGHIIHAETSEHPKAQAKSGLSALCEVVGWRGGRVDEIRDPEEPERTIEGEWQSLLLDAAQRADEARDLSEREDGAR